MADLRADLFAPPSRSPTAAMDGAAARWRQTLWAMVMIQFVTGVAHSLLVPIMPLMLPELGVRTPAAINLWAGILGGTTSFVAAFAAPIWGRLSDTHGRKLMLLRACLAFTVFTALMGLTVNVWQFFACRALMGVFAGFSSAAIALVASQVPEERLGYALGWLGTGQLVGSLGGPLIGGLIADLSGSYRLPYFCTAVTLFCAMAVIWFLVPEEFTKPQKDALKAPLFASMLALARSPALLALFFVLLMAQFGVKTVQPMITLYVKEMVGDLPTVATLAGIAFSITGVANIIAAPLLGGRSDRGAAFGMTSSATFLGNSIGPLLGGLIAAGFGLSWVFVMTGVVMAMNFVWVYRRVPEHGAGRVVQA